MSTLLDMYQLLKQKIVKEKDLIEAEAFEELELLLKEKNEIIEKIDKLALKNSEQKGQPEKNGEAADSQTKEILAAALKAQTQNIELLSQKKGDTKTKILELYSRQKSIKGYLNPGQQEAKFFDEQS